MPNPTAELTIIIRRGFYLIVRVIRTVLHINIVYRCGNFSIILPAYHKLPTYQHFSPQYDRFLPHLVKHLEPGSTVIDVGANCGDTLAAMYSANGSLTYISIEADEGFFAFLQENASRMRATSPAASIMTIKAFVGRNIESASLEGAGGTKRAVVGVGRDLMRSQQLDHIVPASEAAAIRLLKTDVDGFDYDVIDSAESLIAAARPILFIECEFVHAYQKAGFERTFSRLRSFGYDGLIMFDNFGAVMLRTDDLDQVIQMFDYLWRQQDGRSTRTIYYFDILTFTDKDAKLVDAVIDAYNELTVGRQELQ